jgi:hypothetical protein
MMSLQIACLLTLLLILVFFRVSRAYFNLILQLLQLAVSSRHLGNLQQRETVICKLAISR